MENGSLFNGVEVSEVRVFDDEQFSEARRLCEDHAGWNQAYKKKLTGVWVRENDATGFQMFKATTEFDLPADLVYDVLHDSEFRPRWDRYMLKTADIGILNPNNDLCYYALGAVPPIKSRDFVLQRSWLDTGEEKFICGRSVWHDDYPPSKSYVRGVVYLTVYYVRQLSKNTCQVTYFTNSDPKGRLPVWLVNRMTKIVAPKMFKKLHKACVEYEAWKPAHRADWKPWRFPEQLEHQPRIDLAKCVPRRVEQELVDETNADDRFVDDEFDDTLKDD